MDLRETIRVLRQPSQDGPLEQSIMSRIVHLVDFAPGILNYENTKVLSRLETLPRNILVTILRHLDMQSRVEIALTNKNIASIARDTILRYNLAHLTDRDVAMMTSDQILPFVILPYTIRRRSVANLKVGTIDRELWNLKCVRCNATLCSTGLRIIENHQGLRRTVKHFLSQQRQQQQQQTGTFLSYGMKALMAEGIRLKVDQQLEELQEKTKGLEERTWQDFGLDSPSRFQQSVFVELDRITTCMVPPSGAGPSDWPGNVGSIDDLLSRIPVGLQRRSSGTSVIQ